MKVPLKTMQSTLAGCSVVTPIESTGEFKDAIFPRSPV